MGLLEVDPDAAINPCSPPDSLKSTCTILPYWLGDRALRSLMKNQALIQDAKSKIIWGEDPAEVKRFLKENGNVADAQVEGLIKAFIAERNAEARGEAIKKITIGSLLLSIPLLYLAVSYFVVHAIFTKILALTCVPGIYGLIKLCDGLILMFKPSSKIDD